MEDFERNSNWPFNICANYNLKVEVVVDIMYAMVGPIVTNMH